MSSWPHAPSKRVTEPGSYIVTAATYKKQHFFRSEARLAYLQDQLFEIALETGWELQAWALFSNHYQFAGFTENKNGIHELTSKLHGLSVNPPQRTR